MPGTHAVASRRTAGSPALTGLSSQTERPSIACTRSEAASTSMLGGTIFPGARRCVRGRTLGPVTRPDDQASEAAEMLRRPDRPITLGKDPPLGRDGTVRSSVPGHRSRSTTGTRGWADRLQPTISGADRRHVVAHTRRECSCAGIVSYSAPGPTMIHATDSAAARGQGWG